MLRKECEKSPTGNMLNDFFCSLKLFEGSTRRLDGNKIKRHLSSYQMRWKSEMLAIKPVPLLISPLSPINIPPNKNYTVYLTLNLGFQFRLFFHFRQRTSCSSRHKSHIKVWKNIDGFTGDHLLFKINSDLVKIDGVDLPYFENT